MLLHGVRDIELTLYHARYFSHELTKRSSYASVDSLTLALAYAQIDLNPHQIEAHSLRSTLHFRAAQFFADEVGLGKAIEAGIRTDHLSDLLLCCFQPSNQLGFKSAIRFIPAFVLNLSLQHWFQNITQESKTRVMRHPVLSG